jgi:hypothetical protein
VVVVMVAAVTVAVMAAVLVLVMVVSALSVLMAARKVAGLMQAVWLLAKVVVARVA